MSPWMSSKIMDTKIILVILGCFVFFLTTSGTTNAAAEDTTTESENELTTEIITTENPVEVTTKSETEISLPKSTTSETSSTLSSSTEEEVEDENDDDENDKVSKDDKTKSDNKEDNPKEDNPKEDKSKEDSKANKDNEEGEDGDDDGEDESEKVNKDAKTNNDNNKDSSKEDSPKEDKTKKATKDTEKDDEDEDNDDDEEEESSSDESECNLKLNSFIREYNFSGTFLPDDFEEVYETMNEPKFDAYNQIRHINDSFVVFERLHKYIDKLQSSTEIIETVMYLFSLLMDKIYEAKIDSQCQADLLQVINGVRRRELWAMRFADSFGSIPTGFLRGVLASFGDFEQCISIKSPLSSQLDRHIYGKYCQVSLRLMLPSIKDYDPSFEPLFAKSALQGQLRHLGESLGGVEHYLLNNRTQVVRMLLEMFNTLDNNFFFYGACFPSTCSTEDIESIVNRFIYPILKTPVSILDKTCDTHPDVKIVKWDNYQWTAIICIAILAFLVILSSLYHFCLDNFLDHHFKQQSIAFDLNNINNNVHEKQTENNLAINLENTQPQIVPKSERSITQQFLLSFSAIQNTEKLLKVDNRFGVVDTIRLVLTFFVYSLQTFDFMLIMTPQLLKDMFFTGPGELVSSNAYWFARLPGIWIDGFMFTLGMMLIGAQFSRLKRADGQFVYMMYVWKRWYRLSIAMIGTFFALYLLPLTGDGPMWFVNDQWILPACKEPYSIISSFLYYSNFNGMRGGYAIEGTLPLCNPPTWFLSMSTQLYLLSPLLFLPLYFRPRFGIALTVGVTILSALSTAAPYLLYELPTYASPTRFINLQQAIRAFLHYHTYPFQYVTALCIGMLTGYAIRRHPAIQFKGGRAAEIGLWFASFGLIISIFVWHNSFWGVGQDNTILNTLGWFVCSKFMLASALGYICYMCCTGRAKTMNRILTMQTLQPIAKLSYGIYLLRVPTIFHRIASPRHTYEMKYSQVWQNVFVDFLITSVMAYFLYLLFEAPSTNIMRIFEQNDLFASCNYKGDDNDLTIDNGHYKKRKGSIEKDEGLEMSNGEVNKAFSLIEISEHQNNNNNNNN